MDERLKSKSIYLRITTERWVGRHVITTEVGVGHIITTEVGVAATEVGGGHIITTCGGMSEVPLGVW